MEFRKIVYFISVAEQLSFSKAAKEQHVSHQALSKQIRMLEEELGVDLLERSTTSVSLTEAGRKLYDLFQPVMQSYEQAGIQMREFVKYKKDTLKISFFNALSYRKIVAPVVQFLMEQEPTLRIETFSVDVGQEQKLLQEDQIDLAIAVKVQESDWQDLPHIVLHSAPFKIIVADTHPWYHVEQVTEEMLQEATLLVYADKPTQGEGAFMRQLPVKDRIQVYNMDTFMGILSQGNAFGVVNDVYSGRDGIYKLLDLPMKYDMESDIICAFKKLHPKVELLKQIHI